MPTPPTLLGTYSTPRFDYGDVVACERRGDVRIVGLSSAPIPWPIGQRLPKGKARSLVLYGALVRAVRRESAEAVAHWWGVKPITVWQWRKALGVGAMTPGTKALKSERLSPVLARARAVRPNLGGAEHREKIAASRRGKPRPPHVVEAMREGRTGKPHDEAARAKMSEAHKRRGTRPPAAGVPWSAEEDEAVRTLTPKDAAQRTGRTLGTVYWRRQVLELPDGRRK